MITSEYYPKYMKFSQAQLRQWKEIPESKKETISLDTPVMDKSAAVQEKDPTTLPISIAKD